MLLRGSLMKLAIMAALLLVVSAGVILSRSPGAARAATQGPIAEYSFDEGAIGTEGGTLEDLSGNGHDGTVEGAEWAHGRYGGALRFDGAEDTVKIPGSSEFDLTEEMTLEAWVRPESESEKWGTVVGELGSGGEPWQDPDWYLFEGGPRSDEPIGGTETATEGETYVSAGEKLPIDSWSHLAFTWDGAEGRVYIDGELVGEAPVGLAWTPSALSPEAA
ncbi:MAG TPA: LamG domain-containing protein [Solirubrobacterales bacterium]